MQVAALRVVQQLPDMGAQVDKRGLVHHILDACVAVSALGLADRLDVEGFADSARPAGRHHDAVGQVHRFFDRVLNEQHGARVPARQT